MWLMLQQDQPDDFVIATNETRSVREFVNIAFKKAGIEISWEGEGVNEIGKNIETGKVVVRISPKFFRPAEVELLIGNPAKAEKKLNWVREISFEQLVERMVKNDIQLTETSIKISSMKSEM
jgi:GDPmannose 4,6-dehydratase